MLDALRAGFAEAIARGAEPVERTVVVDGSTVRGPSPPALRPGGGPAATMTVELRDSASTGGPDRPRPSPASSRDPWGGARPRRPAPRRRRERLAAVVAADLDRRVSALWTPSADALRRIAPTTIFQGPDGGPRRWRCSPRLRRVPAWELGLGDDVRSGPDALAALLAGRRAGAGRP
jgi:hypothetical protein